MPTVVYVAGLSHSGSTLLHMMLASHPRAVGLGEAFKTLAPGPSGLARSRSRRCTCGKAMEDCPFWGHAAARVPSGDDASFDQRRQYQLILETFGEVFGHDALLVDSSKYLRPLEVLSQMEAVDLRVVHILRDVRSYTISQLDNSERKLGSKEGVRQLSPRRWFQRWYDGNRKLAEFLAANAVASFQLGYEELVLAPDLMVEKLCGFLGVAPDAGMLAPDVASNHMVRGNWGMAGRAQTLDSQRAPIRYDYRWFRRSEWVGPALLSRKIMRFNAEHVYANEATDLHQ